MKIMNNTNIDYAKDLLRRHQSAFSFIAPIIPIILIQQWIFKDRYKKINAIEPKLLVTDWHKNQDPEKNLQEKEKMIKQVQASLDRNRSMKVRFKAGGISLAITLPLYAIGVIACRILAKKC